MDNREIIRDAKRLLARPIDEAHGIEHHRAVVHNCLSIVAAEKLTSADVDALVMAAWWHDLETQQGATAVLRRELETHGFSTDRVEKICSIVAEHTYGKEQTSLEAKILYDADKMEYFNPSRMRHAIEDAKRGSLPTMALATHYTSWCERHETVLTSFHFPYSRAIATKRLPETKAEIGRMGVYLASVQAKANR